MMTKKKETRIPMTPKPQNSFAAEISSIRQVVLKLEKSQEDLHGRDTAEIVRIKQVVSKLEKSQEDLLKQTKELTTLRNNIVEMKKAYVDNMSYSKGFWDGRKYTATIAEEILVKNKQVHPAFWVSTLARALTDPEPVIDLTVKKVEEEG